MLHRMNDETADNSGNDGAAPRDTPTGKRQPTDIMSRFPGRRTSFMRNLPRTSNS